MWGGRGSRGEGRDGKIELLKAGGDERRKKRVERRLYEGYQQLRRKERSIEEL